MTGRLAALALTLVGLVLVVVGIGRAFGGPAALIASGVLVALAGVSLLDFDRPRR